MTNLTNVML